MSHFENTTKHIVSNFKLSRLITKSKRDLILSILRSTTTKREAKQFLAKYQDQLGFEDTRLHVDSKKRVAGPPFGKQPAIDNVLDQYRLISRSVLKSKKNESKSPMRLALFKLSVADISTQHLDGIAETLNRLVQLGVSPVILCGHDTSSKHTYKSMSTFLSEQAERLSSSLSSRVHGGLKLLQTNVLRSLFAEESTVDASRVRMGSLDQILAPLYQGIIPLIIPVSYDPACGSQRLISSDDAIKVLCSELSENPQSLTIEKIVFIDSLGGIPSIERSQTSHVFINLSQEYSDIISELHIGHLESKLRERHISNLDTMDVVLRLIFERTGNNAATGIVTTPYVMSINDDQLNPVVYNVLTDRPIISSSLPSALQRTPQLSTSIIKKGFDVAIIDQLSYNGEFNYSNLVRDGVIDNKKLFDLIADSFGKNLKTSDYLNRINESLATIIIVGDYEGAAIITWEEMSNGAKVAYLDKFAIAKRNQGIPSLADVIFKSAVQSHSSELLWRSRANNPVNKWYFERCRGCVSSNRTQWKLFFTGDIYNSRMGKKIDGTEQSAIDITEKLRLYSELVENLKPSFD